MISLALRFGPASVLALSCVLPSTGAELFSLADVKLTGGPFLHAIKLNRDQLVLYDPDRLLAPFLAEAGLEPRAPRYPNWESMGLDGHTAGHYLSALANTAAALGDAECRRRLDDMVAELARCQEAGGDGYVGGVPGSRELWHKVAAGEVGASGFSLDNRWAPLYNLHKTFAGLRDAWLVAGNEQAKEVLIRFTDWAHRLVSGLSDDQLQEILKSEHGGLNETFADVAAITGDDKYLALAERFSHREILDPLAAGQDRLTGLHANTQVPKIIGFERIAQLRGVQTSGGERYHHAAVSFWENVVRTRTIALGGNSISEHFPAPSQSGQWIEHREGPETCNTYNMLRLSERLFETDPQCRLADFYERAVMNHILSSQHPRHGGYVYFTPARPRHYRVYSEAEQAFWCCVGSGMESHSRYGRFIYARDEDSLYVNLFAPSELAWRERGVVVKQQTRFPDESRTSLTLSLESPQEFALRVRHPGWASEKGFQILINGGPWDGESAPGSYAAIKREWAEGDVVEVRLPMETTIESLPFRDDYVALVHGPIVLAAETGRDDLRGLVAGPGRMDHVATGPLRPLNEAPMLVAARDQLPGLLRPVSNEPLTFTLAGAVRPDRFDDLVLKPFFRVHDARYMLYWRLVGAEEWDAVQEAMQSEEQAKLALDRATVDRVAPGEQQPETEHNFRGERTSTGVWRDRRFRHADGWFSYDLQTHGESGLKLRVTYFGSDRRHFDILVNDQLLSEVRLGAPAPDKFIDRDYELPAERIAGEEAVNIKFAARAGSMAGGVFDVRLMKADAE